MKTMLTVGIYVQDNVINASTWLSNIMPTPKGEEEDISRETSPQHRAISQVQVGLSPSTILPFYLSLSTLSGGSGGNFLGEAANTSSLFIIY